METRLIQWTDYPKPAFATGNKKVKFKSITEKS